MTSSLSPHFGARALCAALLALCACGPSAASDESEASSQGESQGETGDGTADETGDETGGETCDPVYSEQTSFDIDVSNWPAPVSDSVAQILDCETTQAEVQGLGLVMDFDCSDASNSTIVGSVQITAGPLGVIDPPMAVGSQVELELYGFNFGGLEQDPTPIDLGFSAQEFIVRDATGLLVGGFSGPGIRDDVWAPLKLEPRSPCGTPPDGEDYEGAMRVSDLQGENADVYTPGVRGEWSVEGEPTYLIDIGRVTRYTCCHGDWQVGGVIARAAL